MLQGKLTTESTLTGSLDCGVVEPTLMEKNITSNGIYNASADNVDGYSKVNVDVEPTLAEKNITANGIYNASADNVDGYSKVNVNVPSQQGNTVAYKDLNDNVVYKDISSNDETIAVSYIEFNIESRPISYNTSGYATPCFTIARPSNVKATTSAVFLDGYTPKALFWQTAGNDKCIAIGSNYINISDVSFNGDVGAFKNYLINNNKKLILPLISTQFINV